MSQLADIDGSLWVGTFGQGLRCTWIWLHIQFDYPTFPVDCYTPEYNCALLWQRLQSAIYSRYFGTGRASYGIGNAYENMR